MIGTLRDSKEYIGFRRCFKLALFLRNQSNVSTQGQAQAMPNGLNRFLQKKGINSQADLEQRIQQNPVGFLRKRG